jgi:CMP-N,N'-diacetyllegionaminic acid synthase
LAEPCLKHTVEWLEQNENYQIDIVVYLQTTDIFRPKGIIGEAVKKLQENEDLDSVFAVIKTHKNFWRKQGDNFSRLAADIPYGMASQQREPIFREDTGIVLATRAGVVKQNRRIGDKVDVVANDSEINFIDIHDAFDFWLAEICIEKLKKEGKLNLYEL